MRKKAMMFQQLAVTLLLVVSFLAYFSVTDSYAGVFSDTAEKSVCELSFAAAAQAKKIGQADKVNLKCPINQINLTYDMLSEQSNNVKSYIENYKGEKFFFQNEIEHSMNKFIAKQMVDAWKASSEGRLDVFENVWSWGSIGLPDKKPLNCVVFSRIKFDEKIQSEFKGETITSINEWLKKNSIKNREGKYTDMMDYLSDDGEQFVFQPYYKYTTDDMLAIVYVRMNLHAGEEFIDKQWNKLSWGTGGLAVGIAAATIFSGGTFLIALPVLGVAGGTAGAVFGDSTTYDALHPPPKAKSFISIMPLKLVNEVCIIQNLE